MDAAAPDAAPSPRPPLASRPGSAAAAPSRSASTCISAAAFASQPVTGIPDDGIRLTDGCERVLCVSARLPKRLLRGTRGAAGAYDAGGTQGAGGLGGGGSGGEGTSGTRWHVDEFELLKEVYRGKTSFLHRARHRPSGALVALKTYRKARLTPLNRFQVEREVRHHVVMAHPNVVALHAAFEDAGHVYLVQEYADGGDLFEAVKRAPGRRFEEPRAVRGFLAPFLAALEHMHGLGILHRDIKPENILLARRRRGAKRPPPAAAVAGAGIGGPGEAAGAPAACEAAAGTPEAGEAAAAADLDNTEAGGDESEWGLQVKVADFGLSICTHHERPVTRAGTLDFMAPEVLVCPDKKLPSDNKDKAAALAYGGAADVWACGVLAYELIVGRCPFEQETRSATYESIMYRDVKFPPFVSDEAKDFISAALSKTASARPSVQQLRQHPWIAAHAAPAQPAGGDQEASDLACSDDEDGGETSEAAADTEPAEADARSDAGSSACGDGQQTAHAGGSGEQLLSGGGSSSKQLGPGAAGPPLAASAVEAECRPTPDSSSAAAAAACTAVGAAPGPSPTAEEAQQPAKLAPSHAPATEELNPATTGTSTSGEGSAAGAAASLCAAAEASLPVSAAAAARALLARAKGAPGAAAVVEAQAATAAAAASQAAAAAATAIAASLDFCWRGLEAASISIPDAASAGSAAAAVLAAAAPPPEAAGQPARAQHADTPEMRHRRRASQIIEALKNAEASQAATATAGVATAPPPSGAAGAPVCAGAPDGRRAAAARGAAGPGGGQGAPARGHAHGLHRALYQDADRRITLGHDNISWDDFISTEPFQMPADAGGSPSAAGGGGAAAAAAAAAVAAVGILSRPASRAGSFCGAYAGGGGARPGASCDGSVGGGSGALSRSRSRSRVASFANLGLLGGGPDVAGSSGGGASRSGAFATPSPRNVLGGPAGAPRPPAGAGVGAAGSGAQPPAKHDGPRPGGVAAARSKSVAAELSAWLEDSIATAASSDAEEVAMGWLAGSGAHSCGGSFTGALPAGAEAAAARPSGSGGSFVRGVLSSLLVSSPRAPQPPAPAGASPPHGRHLRPVTASPACRATTSGCGYGGGAAPLASPRRALAPLLSHGGTSNGGSPRGGVGTAGGDGWAGAGGGAGALMAAGRSKSLGGALSGPEGADAASSAAEQVPALQAPPLAPCAGFAAGGAAAAAPSPRQAPGTPRRVIWSEGPAVPAVAAAATATPAAGLGAVHGGALSPSQQFGPLFAAGPGALQPASGAGTIGVAGGKRSPLPLPPMGVLSDDASLQVASPRTSQLFASPRV